ncbi:hypothetical protein PVK06_048705 [Gossypium arboreum]|uniref:Uncharacterized protein n=1 Tax=Gossypium arboreum TaxID=29729 RepID=A0ABR0MGM3_GOSAR|nr:hypothetical protein PVK06_048705 [Gossypium arboreum]
MASAANEKATSDCPQKAAKHLTLYTGIILEHPENSLEASPFHTIKSIKSACGSIAKGIRTILSASSLEKIQGATYQQQMKNFDPFSPANKSHPSAIL